MCNVGTCFRCLWDKQGDLPYSVELIQEHLLFYTNSAQYLQYPVIHSSGHWDTQSTSRQISTTCNSWKWRWGGGEWGFGGGGGGVKWKTICVWMGGLLCKWIVIWKNENMGQWCYVMTVFNMMHFIPFNFCSRLVKISCILEMNQDR